MLTYCVVTEKHCFLIRILYRGTSHCVFHIDNVVYLCVCFVGRRYDSGYDERPYSDRRELERQRSALERLKPTKPPPVKTYTTGYATDPEWDRRAYDNKVKYQMDQKQPNI